VLTYFVNIRFLANVSMYVSTAQTKKWSVEMPFLYLEHIEQCNHVLCILEIHMIKRISTYVPTYKKSNGHNYF